MAFDASWSCGVSTSGRLSFREVIVILVSCGWMCRNLIVIGVEDESSFEDRASKYNRPEPVHLCRQTQ